jgi:hypothetical protein
MNNKLRFITMVLAAGATAAAIASTPTAFAAEATRACGDGGGATICQSPGNVEIHTEPRIQAPQIYGPFSSPIPFLFN